jgi:hypothetical protein
MDIEALRAAEAAFAAAGFRHLGDFEDLTSSATHPGMRAVCRVMGGDDWHVVATIGCFDVSRVRGAARLARVRWTTIDLSTELSDGTLVVTVNDEMAASTGDAPTLRKYRYPPGTPPARLLAHHREHAAAALVERAGAAPRPLATLGDVLAAADREWERQRAHRRSRGYVGGDDVSLFADGNLNEASGSSRGRWTSSSATR